MDGVYTDCSVVGLHTLARICGGKDFLVLMVGSVITGIRTSRGCGGV